MARLRLIGLIDIGHPTASMSPPGNPAADYRDLRLGPLRGWSVGERRLAPRGWCRPVPGPSRPRQSVHAVQAVVRPGVKNLPAVTPGLLMAVSDQQHQASIRVADDVVKLDGRVAVPEVARPASQESVEIPKHLQDCQRRRSRPVACTRSRARRLACREGQRARNATCLSRWSRGRTERW
jgi:hypothetical protein